MSDATCPKCGTPMHRRKIFTPRSQGREYMHYAAMGVGAALCMLGPIGGAFGISVIAGSAATLRKSEQVWACSKCGHHEQNVN